MRILYTLTRTENNPAADYLLDLVRGFSGRFDIRIATAREGSFTSEARSAGAKCHVLPALDWRRNPWRAAQACRQFVELAASLKPDLIEAHDRPAALLAHRCGAPSVYTAHRWNPLSWLDRLAVLSSGFTTTASDEARRSVARHCGIDPLRTATIRRGISDEGARAIPARGIVPNFVAVSAFDGTTNDQLILEAFAGIDSPALLTFIGEGHSLPWMRGVAARLGISGRVRFAGARQELTQTLAAAHGLAWAGPAQTEVPAAIVHAMRAGLPVVATDTGLVHEAITNGENGYLVPSGDTAGFRNAMWALAADSSLRKRTGSAGRLRFELSFSIDQMLEKAESLYQRATGRSTAHLVHSTAAAV